MASEHTCILASGIQAVIGPCQACMGFNAQNMFLRQQEAALRSRGVMKMHSIKVSKTELISKMSANRETHRSEFLKAQEGYRAAVIEELDRMLAEARTGKRIRRSVELIEPHDHTKEYDQVLAMLGMSVDDTVELDYQQFAQYVLDEWNWKAQFTATNSRYSGGR